MAQFSLTPDPTYPVKVAIPVPGKKPTHIEFTFKHRNHTEFKAFCEKLGEFPDDTAAVLEIASGWDLKDAFDRENVEKLITNYLGSAKSIIDKYLSENAGARLGN